MRLEEFISQIRTMGLDEEEILGAIRQLYMAGGKIPYEKGSEEKDRTQLTYFKFSEKIVEILKKFGLMEEGVVAIGTGADRVYFHALNEKGMEVGSEIIVKALVEDREGLVELFSKYPKKLLLVICAGTVGYGGLPSGFLRLELQNFQDMQKINISRKSLLETMTNFISSTEFNFVLKAVGGEIKRYVKEYGYANASEIMRRDYLEEITRKYGYIFSQFMIKCPEIFSKAKELFEELASLNYSIKLPAYTTRGIYIYDTYIAPREVTEFIFSIIGKVDMRNEILNFVKLSLLLRGQYERGFTKGKMLEFAKLFGLGEDFVKDMINAFAERGITSRYNEIGSLEQPAFIVLNDEEFEKKIFSVLNHIVSEVLIERN